MNMKEVTFKMKINRSFSLLARTTVAVVAVTLVGCASFATSTPEQLVKNRSTEFWRARIAGDTAKAYALSTPSYRKVKTAEQYKTQFGGNVGTQSAEVTNVSCEPTKCTVTLKLDVKPAIPGINIGIVPMYMDEVWLLEDGQWWHFQEV
jgi:hypothetical protein